MPRRRPQFLPAVEASKQLRLKTFEQLTVLRTIGEYQGKQELYFKQSPEILKRLQQIAIIESRESSKHDWSFFCF